MKMIPILFPPDATDYSTQGLGALADAITCKVSEELNGEYELEMTYPASGRRYADIKNRCLIYCAPDPYRSAQPFRIYRITRPLDGVITVYAEHISYDLSGVPVNTFSATGAQAALSGLKSNAAVSNPFTFWTDISSDGEFSVAVPSSTRSVLGGSEGSILNTFGGEYEWDGFTVRLRSRRGQDNGVRIAYGKNLTDIEQDENISSLATGVIGYWAGSDGELVQTPVVDAPGTYNFSRVITVDFSGDFEEKPTVEQLQERAQKYVEDNDIGVPDVSISVSWAQLEQYSGYEGLSLLERVSLGDTVTVEFPALGVEATARVAKTVYDALHDRYESAEIGSVKATIADTIADQQQQISNQPDKNEIQQIAQAITDAILGANGGSVRLLDTDGDGEPDTLYIADNADPALAKKVWRFNYEGWGASSNGYNGPFEMSAALGMGMYADFITVGVLTAIRIQSADGRSSWDLSSGASVFNANSISINSDNFKLSVSGEVTAAGSFTTNNGVTGNGRNETILSTGDLTFYRTTSDGVKRIAAQMLAYGTNAACGRLFLNGPSNTGEQNEQLLATTDFGGSRFSMRDGAGAQKVVFNAAQGGNGLLGGNLDVQGDIGLGVSHTVSCQNLSCWGDKLRVIPTSFGMLGMNAMESPTPLFVDVGSGVCDDKGTCYLMPDPHYAETISRTSVLRWQVTPTSKGALWVEQQGQEAIVHGEARQTFVWACFGVQKGYDGVYADPSDAALPPDTNPAYSMIDYLDAITERAAKETESLILDLDYDALMDDLIGA